MRLIAFRVTLLACAVAAPGLVMGAAPLLWLAGALAIVGLAAMVAALAGLVP